MKGTHVFERGERLYIVGPVTPFDPEAAELEEIAFAEDLRKIAPNEHIGWMRGQYVEADKPNLNGQLWTADEIAIKSLTPMLMPVTVMHDPRTAVGLIADTQLLTPDEHKVPRARIDTTLGIWKDRFSDTWEEAAENYKHGTLMQSMECKKGWYECGACGRRYVPLPGDAEQANWCEHLRGEVAAESGIPVRRLGAICFTGTGLIFGTRGARGALPDAQLEVLEEEVAEFHEHQRDRKPIPRSTKSQMDISQERYDELVKAENELQSLKPRVETLEESAAKVPDLEKQVETLETEKVAVTKERDDLKGEKEKLEETARADELKTERWGKLGKDFLAKLGEITRGRLEDQAKTYKDEEWAKRIEELEELTEVKSDAGGKPEANDETLKREETARSQLGGGGSGTRTSEPTEVQRRSTIGGLVKTLVKD